VLRDYGYHVLEARNGLEALQVAAAHRGRIGLLLSDVVMPEMGGRLLAEQLTQVRPDVRVLFMSGYTDDAIMRHGISQHRVSFLQKPFTTETLARRVREVLDAPAEPIAATGR
jgi:response regulator RpfG family c-di-GMP phosphodiesterase